MAFGYTLTKRGVLGNVAYKIYDVTDIQSTGNIIHTGFRKLIDAFPLNETSAAGMQVAMADATASTTGTVTLTATNDEDGFVMVIGVGCK